MAGLDTPQSRYEQILYWMNTEIPRYLDKFSSYEAFDAAMPAAAASWNWKQFAYAMAKERWKVPTVECVPG